MWPSNNPPNQIFSLVSIISSSRCFASLLFYLSSHILLVTSPHQPLCSSVPPVLITPLCRRSEQVDCSVVALFTCCHPLWLVCLAFLPLLADDLGAWPLSSAWNVSLFLVLPWTESACLGSVQRSVYPLSWVVKISVHCDPQAWAFFITFTLAHILWYRSDYLFAYRH